MTFEQSQLTDEKVEELANSEWFARVIKEFFESKKKDKSKKKRIDFTVITVDTGCKKIASD